MARLVGFIANRPDLGARALSLDLEAFTVRVPDPALVPASADGPGSVSWGVGFYQGAEILLKRRPFDERTVLAFPDLVRDIRADVLIGHVRTATVGALRTENTHPFRYRQWLYAQTGTLPLFDEASGQAAAPGGRLRARMLESLPQFLARDVRGDTDAELVFYLFLSFLHDANKLDRMDISAADARGALRSTLSLVERLSAEESPTPVALNILLACAEYVIGVRGSTDSAGKPLRPTTAMGYRVLSGRQALERMFGDESFSRTKVPHLTSARIAVVGSDFDDDRLPADYVALTSRATVTLTHSDTPHVENL